MVKLKIYGTRTGAFASVSSSPLRVCSEGVVGSWGEEMSCWV